MCEEGVTPLFGTLHSAQWESSPCEACWPTWRATASPLTCGAAKHVDHLRVWSDFNASFHRLKIRFSYCTTVRSAILFHPNDPNKYRTMMHYYVQCFGRQVWNCEQKFFERQVLWCSRCFPLDEGAQDNLLSWQHVHPRHSKSQASLQDQVCHLE